MKIGILFEDGLLSFISVRVKNSLSPEVGVVEEGFTFEMAAFKGYFESSQSIFGILVEVGIVEDGFVVEVCACKTGI